ncbi:MAG: IPTL-CTERM sorting domain-containing protein [Deltaproteobacteria bacterium]|nr:IPTL-CTERM sorting domain-containing protein [Deltaproteobacteria bacterium]
MVAPTATPTATPTRTPTRTPLSSGGGGTSIPTLSEWGLIVFALGLLGAGTAVILRRRVAIE